MVGGPRGNSRAAPATARRRAASGLQDLAAAGVTFGAAG